MAQDLITYVTRLNEILPSEESREELREKLTIGENLCCWFCCHPKPQTDYTGDSIVCNTCLPDLVRKVEATKLALAGKGFSAQMAKLRKSSEPEFINEVDNMFAAMKSRGMSLGEETIELYETMTGRNLDPIQKRTFKADNRTAARLLNLIWDATHKRDQQLDKSNPLGDISDEDLLGAALQAVIENMITDPEYALTVVGAMYDRFPGFVDVIYEAGVISESEVKCES